MLTLLTLNVGRKLCHGAHQQLSDKDDHVQCSDPGLALFSHRERTFSSDYGSPYFYLWRCWVYFAVYQHPLEMFCFCYASSQIRFDRFFIFLFSIYTWWWITGTPMLAQLWAQTTTYTSVVSISGYKLFGDRQYLSCGYLSWLASQTSLNPHQLSTIFLISLCLPLN